MLLGGGSHNLQSLDFPAPPLLDYTLASVQFDPSEDDVSLELEDVPEGATELTPGDRGPNNPEPTEEPEQ